MTRSRTFVQAKGSPAELQRRSSGLAPAPLDLPALLEQLADLLGPITHSAPLMIFLLDPVSKQYTAHMARGAVAKTKSSFGLDSEIARWLGAHDRPLYLVEDQDHAAPHQPSHEDMQVLEGMLLFIPLCGRRGVPEDRPAGWVALGPRPTGEPYSPEDLQLIEALVDRAALAIENGHLLASVAELELAKIGFMDFVAHEMKQPMTSMQGYAKMLMLGIGGELSERQSQFAQVISDNVDRMGRMVHNLLEISRLEAGRIKLELEQLQAKAIVDQAMAAIQAEMEAREHSVEVYLPEDLPSIKCDRDRLLQILGYLLSNACRYTPDGGTIRVSVSESDPRAAPRHLLFSISDTGIGISAEDLDRLDKFFRADHDLVVSQPGTGLGISIARGLIELHGGELTIESEPDRGSTFCFTMPIAESNGD